MNQQRPTIGRIVWYQAHGSPNGEHKSEPRPAIVTRVVPLGAVNEAGTHAVESCDLAIFNPSGMFFNSCRYDEGGAPGTWRWPTREV